MMKAHLSVSMEADLLVLKIVLSKIITVMIQDVLKSVPMLASLLKIPFLEIIKVILMPVVFSLMAVLQSL